MNDEKKYEARNFVQESYDKNNEWAISIVKTILEKKGYSVEAKEGEDFEVDIKAHKGDRTILYEAEVKSGYPFTSRETFPFNSVSFTGRKKKYANGNGFFYCIICRETECVAVCHSKEIYKDEYKETININTETRKGEDELYRVPKDKCYFYDAKKDIYIN